MKLKAIVISIIICLILYYLFKASSFPVQTQLPKGQDHTWAENTLQGIHIWIAMDSVIERSSFQRRIVILFMQPQDFSGQNLKIVFAGLSQEYNEPYDLFITAYSDREMVRREINVRRAGVIADPAEGVENTKAYKEYAGKYLPLEVGYYRAHYHRMNGEEAFDYSPDPRKRDQTQVILKEKVISYTGDSTADLMLAIKEGDKDKAQDLVSKNIDGNARDKYGDSLLILAIHQGYNDVVKILLDTGAQVNLQNSDGLTALMFAAAGGETEITKLLLARGAEINLKNNTGYSALMFAAANEHSDIVNILLAHKADINLMNKYGETAMIKAASKGYALIVKTLLKHGADLNIKDTQGKSAIAYAKENKHEDIALLLEKAGAK